jgi:hypothetical protein
MTTVSRPGDAAGEVAEVLALWRSGQRLVDALPAGSNDRRRAEAVVSSLRVRYARIVDEVRRERPLEPDLRRWLDRTRATIAALEARRRGPTA